MQFGGNLKNRLLTSSKPTEQAERCQTLILKGNTMIPDKLKMILIH